MQLIHKSPFLGLFPYGYLNDVDQLNETSLPPVSCWYSGLKSCNILSADYDAYMELLDEGYSTSKALQCLNLDRIPKNATETLQELKTLWENENFLLRDYATFYLKKDIEPMLEASVKQSDLYFNRWKINIFRDHMGLPSIAAKVAMRQFAKQHKPVFVPSSYAYKLLNKHMIGGLSILFSMQGLKGITKLCAHFTSIPIFFT